MAFDGVNSAGTRGRIFSSIGYPNLLV